MFSCNFQEVDKSVLRRAGFPRERRGASGRGRGALPAGAGPVTQEPQETLVSFTRGGKVAERQAAPGRRHHRAAPCRGCCPERRAACRFCTRPRFSPVPETVREKEPGSPTLCPSDDTLHPSPPQAMGNHGVPLCPWGRSRTERPPPARPRPPPATQLSGPRGLGGGQVPICGAGTLRHWDGSPELADFRGPGWCVHPPPEPVGHAPPPPVRTPPAACRPSPAPVPSAHLLGSREFLGPGNRSLTHPLTPSGGSPGILGIRAASPPPPGVFPPDGDRAALRVHSQGPRGCGASEDLTVRR